jgi:2'-5' RNA ligase
MATSFYIEYRLRGYSRKYEDWVKKRAYDKAKELKASPSNEQLPHITLYGPAITKNIGKVKSELVGTCEMYTKKYPLIPFSINGFSRFDNKNRKVIYLEVNPSRTLKQFRWELSENLRKKHRSIKEPLSITKSVFDDKEHFEFHSTIIIFDYISKNKFGELYDYLDLHCRLNDYDHYRKQHEISLLSKLQHFLKKRVLHQKDEERSISQYLLRVTALGKSKKIMFEHDLILHKTLNRWQALSRYWWLKTIRKFRELQGQS